MRWNALGKRLVAVLGGVFVVLSVIRRVRRNRAALKWVTYGGLPGELRWAFCFVVVFSLSVVNSFYK